MHTLPLNTENANQASDAAEQVFAVPCRIPPVAVPVDQGGEDAERISPQEDELPFRKEPHHFVHDEEIGGRLIEEIAGGGLLGDRLRVEAQREFPHLRQVARESL